MYEPNSEDVSDLTVIAGTWGRPQHSKRKQINCRPLAHTSNRCSTTVYECDVAFGNPAYSTPSYSSSSLARRSLYSAAFSPLSRGVRVAGRVGSIARIRAPPAREGRNLTRMRTGDSGSTGPRWLPRLGFKRPRGANQTLDAVGKGTYSWPDFEWAWRMPPLTVALFRKL